MKASEIKTGFAYVDAWGEERYVLEVGLSVMVDPRCRKPGNHPGVRYLLTRAKDSFYGATREGRMTLADFASRAKRQVKAGKEAPFT